MSVIEANGTYLGYSNTTLLNGTIEEDFWNDTTDLSTDVLKGDYKRILKTVHDIIVMIIAGSAMLAMGCDISVGKVMDHLKLPKPAVLGLFGQYILMPFSGYAVVRMLKIPDFPAAGIVILCCSPGGGYSNLISFLTFGDVPLSVLMTTLSSLLSLVLTPLNLWVYGNHLMSMEMVMPFANIIITLLILQAILSVGILIKWKLQAVAAVVTKVGVAVSVILLFARQILTLVIQPSYYMSLSWKIYAAVVTIPLVGLVVPFFLAMAFKQPFTVCRTIAYETAIQSIGTAFTIALVSFPTKVLWDVQSYIALYSDVTVTGFVAVAVLFRFFYWACKRNEHKFKHIKVNTDDTLIDTIHEKL